MVDLKRGAPSESVQTHNQLYLRGWPSLKDFVQYIVKTTADRGSFDDATMVAQWREAHRVVKQLEVEEAGWADNQELTALPDVMSEIAARKLQEPGVQRALRFHPYRWSMVEIDRLVVFQRSVNLAFANGAATSTPTELNQKQLIELAVGRDRAPDNIQFIQQADNVYSLTSTSSDVRCLEIVPLDPALLPGGSSPGYPSLVVAIFMGLGINLFSAISLNGRLLLLNGTHRMYALRSRGITHVPCLVHMLSSEDGLEVFNAGLEHNAALYFRSRRPPAFKDYFDPRLHVVIPTIPSRYLLQVQVVHQRLRAAAGGLG